MASASADGPLPFGKEYVRKPVWSCLPTMSQRAPKTAEPLQIQATPEAIAAYLERVRKQKKWSFVIDPRKSRLMSVRSAWPQTVLIGCVP